MPLGMGYTVEGQVTGEERHGGLQLVCFDPKPGASPTAAAAAGPLNASRRGHGPFAAAGPECPSSGAAAALSGPRASPAVRGEMGLAAGGRMRQQLYPDPHGPDTWDERYRPRLRAHRQHPAPGAISPASRCPPRR